MIDHDHVLFRNMEEKSRKKKIPSSGNRNLLDFGFKKSKLDDNGEFPQKSGSTHYISFFSVPIFNEMLSKVRCLVILMPSHSPGLTGKKCNTKS